MNTLNFRDAAEYQCSLHETCLVTNAVLLLQPYPIILLLRLILILKQQLVEIPGCDFLSLLCPVLQ